MRRLKIPWLLTDLWTVSLTLCSWETMHVYICFSFLCRPLIFFSSFQPFCAFDFTNKFHDFSITFTISTNFPDLFWNSPTLKNFLFILTVATLIISVSDFSIEFGNEFHDCLTCGLFCLVIGLKLKKKTQPIRGKKKKKNNYALTCSLRFSRAQRRLYLFFCAAVIG